MILVGQYDSPFVRRVGIALTHYDLTFEHRPWSVWGNAAQIAEYNPLRRVPTLLLEDGPALVDTFAILDYLDELVSAKGAHLLVPRSGTERRDVLRVAALASGIADKAVTLLYSSLDLIKPSGLWTERCQAQIVESFTFLEAERAKRSSRYWFGETLTHADIAIACTHRFTREALPGLLVPGQVPTIAALADRCEALPEFKAVYLPITNNLEKS